MKIFVACLVLAMLAWCQCTTPVFNPITGEFNCSTAGVKQTANYFYAGPASGSTPAPAGFRALVSADIPDNAANASGQAGSLSGNQTPNYFYAGPASGSTAAPAGFRALVSADIPANAANTSGLAANLSGNQTPNYVYAGPASGSTAAPAGFRALVSANIPANAANTSGLAANLSGNQTANYIYAGPASGAAAPAGFRPMAAADLPTWVCVPTTYTLAYTDSIFTAAASTVTKTLLTLTGTTQVLCDPAETTGTLYAGTGVTAMNCSVGTATAGNAAAYMPAINVFATSPSYTASASMRPGDLAVPDSSLAVVVSCTANTNFGSGTVTVLTAGSIKITLGVKTLP